MNEMAKKRRNQSWGSWRAMNTEDRQAFIMQKAKEFKDSLTKEELADMMAEMVSDRAKQESAVERKRLEAELKEEEKKKTKKNENPKKEE